MLPTHPKSTKVPTIEYYNWRHHQHGEKKCYCGKFACVGFNYRYGMLELLCFKHYEERIKNGSNQETKKTNNGFTKSYSQKTKEKERKIICHTEKEHTEVKLEDQKNQINLL